MMNSGARILSYSDEIKHASAMYEEIRKRTTDCSKIVKSIGGILSIEQIQAIKYYVFYSKHFLEEHGNFPVRFTVDYEIAESWKRLTQGEKHIKQLDIIFLFHELRELTLLLSNSKMSQKEAHNTANIDYNYSLEVRKHRVSCGKYW